jgi:hypothetical protein
VLSRPAQKTPSTTATAATIKPTFLTTSAYVRRIGRAYGRAVIYSARKVTLAIEQEDGLTLQQVYEWSSEVFAVEVTRESGFPKAEEGGVSVLLLANPVVDCPAPGTVMRRSTRSSRGTKRRRGPVRCAHRRSTTGR